MAAPPKLYNAGKYWEFHKRNGHTVAKCRELKKALYELANKGHVDHFVKRDSRVFNKGKAKSQ